MLDIKKVILYAKKTNIFSVKMKKINWAKIENTQLSPILQANIPS